jgi:hypothetical protein
MQFLTIVRAITYNTGTYLHAITNFYTMQSLTIKEENLLRLINATR